MSVCAARRLDAEFCRDGYLCAAGFAESSQDTFCFAVSVVAGHVEVVEVSDATSKAFSNKRSAFLRPTLARLLQPKPMTGMPISIPASRASGITLPF
jgi:hypothetical protein